MRKSYSICEVLRQVGTNLRELCAKVRAFARKLRESARNLRENRARNRAKARSFRALSRKMREKSRKMSETLREKSRKTLRAFLARAMRAIFAQFSCTSRNFSRKHTPDFNSGQKWSSASARGNQRRKTGAMCEGFRGGRGDLRGFCGSERCIGDDERGISREAMWIGMCEGCAIFQVMMRRAA